MNKITNNDYKKILEFYKISIPKSKKMIKIEAEKILATKLCRCIKKVGLENESKAIGICTKTILNRKGLTRGKFKCKGNRLFHLVKLKKIENKILLFVYYFDK